MEIGEQTEEKYSYLAAIHEAGHAFASQWFGMVGVDADITPKNIEESRMGFSNGKRNPNHTRSQQIVYSLVSLLAGSMAESIYYEYPFGVALKNGGEGDYETFKQVYLLYVMYASREEMKEFSTEDKIFVSADEDDFIEMTRKIVVNNLDVIEEIADYLMEHGKIDSETIQNIIDSCY